MKGGSHVELDLQPTGFTYKINGVAQTTSLASGNNNDPLTSELCAALVAEAEVSLAVRDSGAAPINNYFYGGAWATTNRTGLMITCPTSPWYV